MTAIINVASSLVLAISASAPPRGASVRSAWLGVAARKELAIGAKHETIPQKLSNFQNRTVKLANADNAFQFDAN